MSPGIAGTILSGTERIEHDRRGSARAREREMVCLSTRDVLALEHASKQEYGEDRRHVISSLLSAGDESLTYFALHDSRAR
jgi:hypothetical protein